MVRGSWVVASAFGTIAIVAACSSYEGVDAPMSTPEAGVSPTSDAAAPCAGKDCPCSKNADCIDPIFSACEKGACRQCSTSPDSCPSDQYCEASTLACVPGCKGEASCPGQHCNPTLHRCVDCVVQNDCPAAKVCTPAGVCAETCSGAAPCTGGKECCNGLCVDSKTDRFNCGMCNKTCTGTSPQCCGGTCSDLAIDARNCGSCGTTCSSTNATPSCQGATCQFACNSGFTHCTAGNTGCDTNTANSVTQCGGCAINCNARVLNATGISCANSTCNYSACNASFADNDNNRSNGCEAAGSGCGSLGGACCNSSNPCTDPANRCDKNTLKCVACQPKGFSCTSTNDLCCSGCNVNTAKCY